MRKIYDSKFSSITTVPHLALFAYAICDFLEKKCDEHLITLISNNKNILVK